MAAAVAAATVSCNPPTQPAPASSAAAPTALSAAIQFESVGPESGIDFVHRRGPLDGAHLIETMGSGASLLDYDGDGDLDLYLVQGGAIATRGQSSSANELYANDGEFRFHPVGVEAGVADRGYGMGACAADYDGDGHVDLYVTNWGPNVLYRNRGDGRFEDVTARAGVGGDEWSSSCTFFDANRDGRLDLYVVNYLEYSPDAERWCGDHARGIRALCHVDAYAAAVDRLYLGTSDGGFRDATGPSGIGTVAGKGLGVVATDYDDDGDVDLFVANDSTANFLWRNRSDGTFEEVGLEQAVAYDADGRAQACMGVAAGDIDGDGRVDLFVTNYSRETNTLYRQLATNRFADESIPSGLGPPSFLDLGFGVALADFDDDGLEDFYVANGHIHENQALLDGDVSYRQRNRLFRNLGGGRFAEVTAAAGSGLEAVAVSRSTVVGDLDADGDLDLVVTRSGDRPQLLRQVGTSGNSWLVVRLRGRPPNTFGLGARVVVETATARQIREARSGDSYLSSSSPDLHFGLGRAERVSRLIVRWPSGRVSELADVAVAQVLVVDEADAIAGGKVVATEPEDGAAVAPIDDGSTIAAVDTALAARPDDAKLHFRRAELARAAGDDRLQRHHLEVHRLLLELDQLERGGDDDPDRAIERLARLVELVPRSSDLRGRLAEALQQGNRLAAAAAVWQRAVADFGANPAWSARALLLLVDAGDVTAAHPLAAELEGAQDADSQTALAALALAGGDGVGALAGFRRVLAAAPKHLEANHRLADLLMRRGDGAGAARHLQIVVERRPEDATLRNNLGMALRAAGEGTAARAELERAVKWSPAWAVAINNLGLVQAELGDLVAARASLAEAVRLDPAMADARLNLGLVLVAAGEPGLAIEHLTVCQRAMRGDPRPHLGLAKAFAALGRSAEAADHAHAAERLGAPATSR